MKNGKLKRRNTNILQLQLQLTNSANVFTFATFNRKINERNEREEEEDEQEGKK